MRKLRFCLLALTLIGIVAVTAYLFRGGPDERRESTASGGAGPAHRGIRLPEVPGFHPGTSVPVEIDYPENAIPGELVLHFPDQRSYLAYLSALREAGYRASGQIDALLAVRVREDGLSAVDPRSYGGRPSFSFTVIQPPPPRVISPEALASLRAYGLSARELSGGVSGGDGSGVLVAILDSGIRPHPQFDSTYIVHVDIAGGGVDGPGAAHGTAVASIISGSEGLAPASELLVVRVLDDSGAGSSFDVADGIVQAVNLGAAVINLSLGSYTDSPLLREAVLYAASRGVVMVAAAGNDGIQGMPYPAAYPEVLSVTAVDANGRQALFPNQSAAIDFSAPGVGVLVAGEDGGTESFSGTSAAAPFVTGTIAAMLSENDGLSAAQKVELIRRKLNDAGAPGPDPVYGGGIIDWQRIRESGTVGVVDLALADIYLSKSALPGTTVPLEVTVQNRGTAWVPEGLLEVVVGGGEVQRFPIESLGSGQVTSRKLYGQVDANGDGLSVVARVAPREIISDVRPLNNLRAVRFSAVTGD